MSKKRIFWITVVLLGAVLLLQNVVFQAAADSTPYSVSLNSPVSFPLDI